MDTIISIIVPVYNGEKFLEKCIDSIQRQTIENWQLLLIDDGSTDGSPAMCDEYAARDKRIQVVHKSNGGVSAARNDGLELVQGKYIGFVDADDWILADMYEKLVDCAEQNSADIVMCDAKTVYADGREELDTISQLSQSGMLNRDDLRPELMLELAGSACRCIYRRSLIQKTGLKYPVGIHFSEDRIFNLYAMGYCRKLYYLKEPYYMRFMNDESAVHRFHADYFERVKKAHEATQKALDIAWRGDKAYKRAYLQQFIGGAIGAINNYYYRTSTFTRREKREAVMMLCKDDELRTAIKETGYGGIRGKWIMGGQITLLELCARYLNLRYRR